MLGCAGPSWLTKEGIVVPFHADRTMVRWAEELAAAHPEWGAHPPAITGGNTEIADALRAGIPAIKLTEMTPSGDASYWHQVEDTADKMNLAILARACPFVWACLDLLDQQLPAELRAHWS